MGTISGITKWTYVLVLLYRFWSQISYLKKVYGKTYRISFSNSVFGFTSRPQQSTETHFYSIKFTDYIKNAHRNLEFGSINLFNHTDIKVEMLNVNKKGFSITYEFQYFGYFKNPEFDYLVHSINLKWKLGKSRKNKK